MAKVNVQQLPNDPAILRCFCASPGCRLVNLDISSLEPRVQAEFSQDSTLIELYASGKPHDVYLYIAGHAIFKDQYSDIDAVYNYDNPTSSSVAEAKSKFVKLRKAAKLFQLAASYNAGPWTLYNDLTRNGFDFTQDEVQEMHQQYWELFSGLKSFERRLHKQLRQNGGYILDGFNQPRCIPPDRERDLINAFSQSTGHNILLLYISIIDREVREQGIKAVPWIDDLHDQTTWEVREEHTEALAEVFRQALVELDSRLGNPKVKIIGDVEIGDCFADFKD